MFKKHVRHHHWQRWAERGHLFGHRGRGHGPFGHGFGGPWGHGSRGGDPFGGDEGGRRRHRRGDIKYALLELLAEQPRHGYELIKELESRYGGFYRPSPGSVYPTLQLLEDEGHLVSEMVDGKRVYTVTESGRALLQERQSRPVDESARGGFRSGHAMAELHALRHSAMALMEAVMQAGRHGTVEQVRAVTARLDAARREIYALLAAEEQKDQ